MGPGHLCDLSTEHSAWHMVNCQHHSEKLKSYSLAILTLFFFLSNVYFKIYLNKQTSCKVHTMNTYIQQLLIYYTLCIF